MMQSGKWFAVALTGLVMAAGQPFAVGASSRTAGVVETEGQEDVSAPATLVGEVMVRTDARGRLAVVVDEERAGIPADGIADRVFLLETERPLEEPIERRFFLASVVFRGTSLYVSAPGTSFTIDLKIVSSNDRERHVGEDSIVLHDGIALQSRRLGNDRAGIDAVSTDAFVTTKESAGGEGAAAACEAGGAGSSSCSKTCSFSSVSISRSDACSITCMEGYYACCGCNMLYKASCACNIDWFEIWRPRFTPCP